MAVEAYLTKPVDFDELLALVHGAVERSHARRRTSSVIERLCSVVADLEAENCHVAFPGNDRRTKVAWRRSARWLPACRTCWSYGISRRRTTAWSISVSCWIAPSARPTARPFCTRSRSWKRRRTASSPSSWRSCECNSSTVPGDQVEDYSRFAAMHERRARVMLVRQSSRRSWPPRNMPSREPRGRFSGRDRDPPAEGTTEVASQTLGAASVVPFLLPARFTASRTCRVGFSPPTTAISCVGRTRSPRYGDRSCRAVPRRS